MKKYTTPFLLLFSFLLFSQEKDTILTRLQKEVREAIVDTTKVKTMLQLGEYQLNRDFDKAEGHFIKALDLIKHKKEDYYVPFRAALYVQMGVVNRRKANYPEAIEYYLKAMKYYEQLKDSSGVGDVYHNMAMVYRYQKEHRKAIEHFKSSISLKQLVRDSVGLGMVYNMLGVSYRQNKQLDSALICYNKAKALFTSVNNQDNIYRVNNNMGVLYQSLQEYDKALKIQFENLDRCRRLGKKLSMCVTHYNISSVYKGKKEWKQSLKHSDSSLQIALEEGFEERASVAYRRKSFVNAKMGDFEDAYENYRKFNRASDKIFNLENEKKIQALELNYEFQKEKQTDSLQFVQEKREVELIAISEASKKKLYFALLLVTLVGGSVIGYLIRRNYQQRSKLAKATYESEKKILDQEIITKEKDIKRLIADNSMRLAFKEELLDTIKNEVTSQDPKNIKQSLNSLTTQLRLQIETESRLSDLQEKIDQVNTDFDKILQQSYPELTKGEREVCALLRLNLSIKEIMTIRNVSVDSVKSMRRRIRKKMNVPSEIELEKFIRELV
ncbi:tetratricopeptide repeat protein [uncultured Aquimarina sp.]|uniref:tetratricopeptide repeat protein n=1 Tax=uncultured Aquimarina sp. TaxID=575652 RepID=UPI00261C4CCB|nr:tetratricopeptide repeat protein [uncultured Aquimarina sp.]